MEERALLLREAKRETAHRARGTSQLLERETAILTAKPHRLALGEGIGLG